MSQPAAPCGELGVQIGPGVDKFMDSPDLTNAESLAQKHVLERFVGFCGKIAHTHFIGTVDS